MFITHFSARRSAHYARRAIRHVSGLAEAQLRASPIKAADSVAQFDDLKGKISDKILKAVTVTPFKFKDMTSVQHSVLSRLPALAAPFTGETTPKERKDIIVRARTGTGKTLAFLIPAIESLVQDRASHNDPDSQTSVNTVIISPTRELALQISTEALKLTTHFKDINVHAFVGGVSKDLQMRQFNRKSREIVVATPGRLRDLLMSEPKVGKALLSAKTLILDEADRLLDDGFRDDLEAISAAVSPPPKRQTFLFSATMSTSVRQIAKSIMSPNQEYINCIDDDETPVHQKIPQYATLLPSAEDQIPHILRLIAHDQIINNGFSKTILFCPTTKMTQLFADILRDQANFVTPAGRNTYLYEIHSKKSQESRTKTSARFRADKRGSSILVTSDVSARGVDYPGVTRVIQVGMPPEREQYIHRVGRTGRGSSEGGRADIVLLPFEKGTVNNQLSDIPLKELTVGGLVEELDSLSKNFADQTSPIKRSSTRSFNKSPPLSNDLASRIAACGTIKDQIQMKKERYEESIKETFASLLGYYAGHKNQIHCSQDDIISGVSKWSTDAMGLASAPYLSQSFLQKLGFGDGGRQSGGFKSREGRSRGPPIKRKFLDNRRTDFKIDLDQTRRRRSLFGAY